ncbi:alpha/beta fold hydrolase [Ureibacillus sinduriensis]|uniref:Alpha/beta hydrolase n=1 Tax=Ureibacillus sinduriensis BLB-1 = JCM 15800 TaxID=1384057 RepID=A0A0A3HWH4_9BACL|nr:alpha/beta hydrolase [Ureibacillus sinduriensis]KGR76951.1 alpha/beta hydrolase [Ureibacillus sinduriensis BLB-1 = JCM 15800]
MKTKKKFKFWIIIRNTLLTLLAIVLVLFISNQFLTAYEQEKYEAGGELVDVEGEKIHVYTKGEGKNTIVLLPGLGTAAPTLDYEPLINEMAEKNKVVVVEPFGYGWSDITKKERTVENIVEEIRMALKKADIEGPFILMPHSLSGIYSMYFANKYPEEVKAIVGIDPTLPGVLEYYGESAPTMPEYLSYLAPTGIARLAVYMNPESILPIAEDGIYTESNLKMTKRLSAWNGYNKTIVNEANEIESNIEVTEEMKFPADMPILIFTTKENNKTDNDKNKVTFYETQLTHSPGSKVITLEGHHYLHWTQYKEMGKEVNEFIRSSGDNR